MAEQHDHPAFPQPANPHTLIWRYLTARKFEWKVREGRLFMPHAAHLGDPLEGMQPTGDANWWQSLIDRASSEDERRTILDNRDLISRFAVAYRTRHYVSCWHINDDIDTAMWKLYAPSTESVAVQTTVARLRAALPDYVYMGMVRYIDYKVDRLPTLNMFEYITHKNKLFEHERELRVVATHPIVAGPDQEHFRKHHFAMEDNPAFLVFAPPVDLTALLEEVVLHPNAPQAYAEQVESLCKQFALPTPRRRIPRLY